MQRPGAEHEFYRAFSIGQCLYSWGYLWNNSQGRASLFAADPSGNGNRGKGNCKGQCFLVHNRGGNTKLYKGGRRNCRISDRSFLKVLSEKALFTDQEKLEMKIVEKTESREKCAEAGWFAWDCLLDHKINREFILSLKPLGGFVYLDMLRQPFFKIENDYYMIKGIEGNNYFRIAVHGKHQEYLEKIEEFVNTEKQNSL